MPKSVEVKEIAWDGKTIKNPGIYSGIGIDLYHAPNICDGPSASSSMLRAMNPDIGSMAHFFEHWVGNAEGSPLPDKRAFVVGRAVHHLLLGEPFFAKLFCVQPGEYVDKDGEVKKWNNNAGKCRDWHKDRRAEGRDWLTDAEVESIKGMSAAIGHHPHAREFLGGRIERSFFWKDPDTGLWLKWRPDAIPTSSMDFTNLKTTQSVMWPDLMNTMRKRAYYQEAALGAWACRSVLKRDMASYTYVFVEKARPYCVRDVRLDEQDFKRGERMNRACLRNFAEGLKTGDWPGPGADREGDEKLGLSQDAREQIDRRIEAEGLADGQD